MANETVENAIFTSEYDNSSFIKGINETIAAFVKASTVQKDVQAEMKKTGESLEQVNKDLKQTTTEFEKVSKAGKGTGEATEALKQKMEALQRTNENLQKNYKDQEAQLQGLKAKNEDLNKTLAQVEATQKKVQETFGKKVAANVDITALNGASAKLQQLKENFSTIASPDMLNELFDTSQLDQLLQHVQAGKGEFEQMNRFVQALSASLVTVEPGTQEFKDLSAAVRAGNQVIKEYTTLYSEATKAVEESEPAYKSIRARLADYRKELDLLEAAGKDETEEFRQVQIAAAQLTDQYGDMQQQIAILASDTKYLDFGLSAVNAAGAGFQVVEGALTLFGVSSDEAAKAQARLLAIMSLVQGAQQLQNLLLKESIIQTVGAKIASETYALSQRILTSVLGATAAASKALNAALITTGVGALIVALGFLISKIMEWTEATDTAKKAQEALEEALKRQGEYMAEDIAMIDLSSKLRAEKIKERGNNERLLYENDQKAYIERVLYYNNRLADLQSEYDRADLVGKMKISEEQRKLSDEAMKLKEANILTQAQETTRLADVEYKRQQRLAELQKEVALKANINNDQNKEMINLKAGFDNQLNELRRQGLSTIEVERLYQVKRQEIIDNYARIRRDKEKEMQKEIALIGSTEEEKEIINLRFQHDRELRDIIRLGENRAMFEDLYRKRELEIQQKYNRLRAEEEKRITQELEKLSFQYSESRIANLEDQFQKERETITVENAKQRAALQQAQTDELDSLLKSKVGGILSQSLYDATVAEVNEKYNGLFDQLEDSTAARNRELGSKILQGAIASMDRQLTIATNNLSALAQRDIRDAANLYNQGKFTYAEYQKALTKIQLDENRRRLDNQKEALEKELALIQQRLLGKITQAERDALTLQQSELNKALAENGAQQAQLTAGQLQTEHDLHFEHLQKVIELYSSFTSIVGGFLQQLSTAEQQRLDRSIALQQQRVDFAKEIASKGNAEYLELEQKRLDELQRKREEAARKQLAIDQALRVSQATVAAISAIASAAATGDPFAAVAAGIAVLGAIAAAYAFVSNLEAPVAEFWEGTTYVEGEPGRDKIPAKVSRGEAIIPVEQNKRYKETVEAVYYQKIPAEVLNQFVANYPVVNYPSLDYSRLGLATDRHIVKGSDSEVTSRLDRVNNTMEKVVEGLSNLNNFSLKLDENGFALSILGAINSEKMKWLN